MALTQGQVGAEQPEQSTASRRGRKLGARGLCLLFDPMKAVVVEDGRADGGRLVENPEFLPFANHWGFRIRACRP